MTIEAPPAHVNIPQRDGSLLRAVKGVCSQIGRTMDPAQELATDVLTSSWSDMRPAALESAVCSSRQNLKTFCLENIALTFMTMPRGAKLAVWSAHEVATAQETHRAFIDLAERYTWLGDRIVSVTRSPGREAIQFIGGRWLRFRARIKTGGRGLAGDLIILDEAFALEPAHMGSLLPILSTRPLGRVIYGSSAPLTTSDILHRIIRRGRAGGAGAPAYVEWSAPGSFAEPGCTDGKCVHEPGTPGCTLDDESLWLRANPGAVYGRISMDYLRAERRALPPLEFARERLGWGEEPGQVNAPFTLAQWDALADPAATSTADPVFALDVAPDRRSGAIAAATRLDDGRPLVEVVRHVFSTAALVDEVEALSSRWPGARWYGAAGSAVEGLVPDLRDRGLRVELVPPREVSAACGALQDAVTEARLVHLGDPKLSAAVLGASRRDVGDGAWIWTRRKSDTDITPLYAVTLAAWGISSVPPPSDVF